jgi:hypothetical protein
VPVLGRRFAVISALDFNRDFQKKPMTGAENLKKAVFSQKALVIKAP